MVRDLDTAAGVFEQLFGYRRVTRPVENTRHQVRGVFLTKAGSLPLKLITPVGGGVGAHRFGPHHLAFLTEDIHQAVREFTEQGAVLVSAPQPGEMFDDELIAFVVAGGVNVELVTTQRWRDRIDEDDSQASG